jgi:hypothetical protein
MEIKINKEIRDFKESVFFGLSMRQFFFSALAVGVAILLYFLLRNFLGVEILSWLCILCAVPFAVFGFFKYNGMYAEEFIVAWIRSEILTPKVLLFKPENIYDELLKNEYKKLKKEALKDDVVAKQKEEKRKSKNTKISTTSNTN